MAAAHKRTHRIFAAWDYESEIKYYDEMSEKGWQLISLRGFSQRFKRDENARYVYQADYRTGIDDMTRYVETFREQNWEFVAGKRGWHIFRKPYDPSLPESEYEIFTDADSLREMRGRLFALLITVTIILGVFTALLAAIVLPAPTLPGIVELAFIAFEFIVLACGTVSLKKRIGSVGSALMRILIPVLIVGIVSSFALQLSRVHLTMNSIAEDRAPISADLAEATYMGYVTVPYPDNYYLDVSVDADTPVTFTLLDSDGGVVYSVSGSQVDENNAKLRLPRGDYHIYLSDFAGGRLDFSMELD